MAGISGSNSASFARIWVATSILLLSSRWLRGSFETGIEALGINNGNLSASKNKFHYRSQSMTNIRRSLRSLSLLDIFTS
jgi:hypothetical protein